LPADDGLERIADGDAQGGQKLALKTRVGDLIRGICGQ
jgi:hypothetical protein